MRLLISALNQVGGLNLSRRQIFANSRLIYTFFIVLNEAAFCRALASVCEAKLGLCVNYYNNDYARNYIELHSHEAL